ncbi:hypothetical protein HYX10_01155 [Candidatus Woesearchaeota archaeon]|nr:hypothetical protein [Candidatus Woesearchaeota archaeon]
MKATKQQAFDWLGKQKIKVLTGIVFVALLSMLLGASVNTVAAALLLITVAAFSTFYFNYFTAPVNFELVKMSTILMAYTHGIVAGLIVGVLSTIIGKVLIGRIDEKLPISVAAISLVAVAAALMPAAGIATLGIILVAAYNVSMFAISLATGGDIGWNLPYEGTNFVINAVLFSRVAPLIAPLL